MAAAFFFVKSPPPRTTGSGLQNDTLFVEILYNSRSISHKQLTHVIVFVN